MDSVRTRTAPPAGVLHRSCPDSGASVHGSRTAGTGSARDPTGVPVLDVIYIAATLALFALVGLIAKGAEKL
jgi:hypothetical protein